MKFSLEKFSSHYKDILAQSVNIAIEEKSQDVLPEHLLTSLLRQRGAVAYSILQRYSLKLSELHIPEDTKEQLELTPILNEETIQVIDESAHYAQENDSQYIGSEHLLFALLHTNNQRIKQLLDKIGISNDTIKNELLEVFHETQQLQELIDPSEELLDEPLDGLEVWGKEKQSALELYAYRIKADENETSPVIGRNEEIEQLCQTLLRKSKNNPLLLGDPGVGKTAIVEGLAQRIQEGSLGAHLHDKKVYALDLSSLIAGTMYRGEFESRLKELLEEVRNRTDIILFIDELHNIIGAGSSQGSMDVANLMKPALARGEIRCIGATTYEEYKKFIAQDPALDRRFQPIQVREPSAKETMEILQGIRTHFESFHRVHISDEALKSAIELSGQYLPDRFYPDKALDLIDQACSSVKMKQRISKKLSQLRDIETTVNTLVQERDEAFYKEDVRDAKYLTELITVRKEEYSELEKSLTQQSKLSKSTVGPREIAKVVSRLKNIPLAHVLRNEKAQLKKLLPTLKAQIIGQDNALQELTLLVQQTRLGLRKKRGVPASCIFVGPSGVGKTMTARCLATSLFHNDESFIKIDMSEFSQPHSIAQFIGSPAGYVGYKEESKIVRQLKNSHQAIVLFDEIEKAHPDIFNILLQILDDGFFRDSKGSVIDMREKIIIMTSNIGGNQALYGFDKQLQKNYNKDLQQLLRPEVLNRIDAVIPFENLKESDLHSITKMQLDSLANRIRSEHKCEVHYSDEVIHHVLKSLEEKNARHIDTTIGKLLAPKITRHLLKTSPTSLTCKMQNNTINITG